jgi:hypothetical protein
VSAALAVIPKVIAWALVVLGFWEASNGYYDRATYWAVSALTIYYLDDRLTIRHAK